MKTIMQRAKEWLGMRQEFKAPSPEVKAEFLLFHGSLLVGTLNVIEGHWQFKYSEEFKLRTELRPLVEFPDLDKIYKNEELWQFFASRIPSTEQPDVEEVLETENIDETDVVALLKRFGTRTITNPFELKYNNAVG
ncbi:MAG: HipA N-terminal domain-containing protein [Pyrinomonadaceae bacterium]|nr:HipA N-terminal domain-containing protein [Pyrinomonadaceae bacterium]